MTAASEVSRVDGERALHVHRADARAFDLTGSLPRGLTLLEASAGTGKTYAITTLAARYVAEGVALERILIVTFTRMATGELRERVRERLLAVKRGLEQMLALAASDDDETVAATASRAQWDAGTDMPSSDPVVALLAAAPAETVRRHHALIQTALANFDAATIATTHGFCQEMLDSLGIYAPLARDAELLEDPSDLVAEVVDDLYVRRFHSGDRPPFTRAHALAIARAAIAHPDAALAGADGDVAQMRRRLALAVRAELAARKQRLALVTYDDLVTNLDTALSGEHGAWLAGRLRSRYDVVLVDEFQDTDPVQWSVVRRAFGDGTRPVVLIADPKQAIYAFRGADVYAYLQAAREAATRATLTVNRRCAQGLIDAYDALFGNASLGEAGITYRRVRAARRDTGTGGPVPPYGAPVRIRVVSRNAVACTRGGFAVNAAAREHIAKDVAGDLVALLSSPVRPADVAVLVRTNRSAALICRALEQAGIPAVINGAGSVFATDCARDWLALLEALERPTSITRAHAVALSVFVGWSAERVAGADDSEWEGLHRRLHDWARLLREHGVASLVQAVSRAQSLPARLLCRNDGERQMTDLHHIGELLHAAGCREQLGPTALTAWLRRRILEADADIGDEDRSRRLESDEQAVQVLTIHRSKGLEFPIVYVPFLWEAGYLPEGQPVACHEPAAGGGRMLDVALEGADFERHREQYVREQRGEELRLAYVALTRARDQAVVWWAGSWDSRNSPLGRLVFFRDDEGNVASAGRFTPSDEVAWQRFESIAAGVPGAISVERSTLALPATWSAPMNAPGTLTVAPFQRSLDSSWRRTSYTDITAAHQRDLHGPGDGRVASEPEEGDAQTEVTDEPEWPGEAQVGEPPVAISGPGGDVSGVTGASGNLASAATLPLAAMSVGADVGTFVHRVLESVDFAALDLDGELARAVRSVRARRAVELGDPQAVRAGLRAAIETPLGPALAGLRLRDVARGDRLDELQFELPLAGGDRPSGVVAPALIGDLMRRRLPANDPLAGYPDRLIEAALVTEVRGYLTGSLDLVIRTHDGDRPRFAIVDYKTNWLAPAHEPLTIAHYRRSALAAEMQRHHYVLQALFYTVALHRYLRWRLPGYDPETDLAGVAYLFLRGMVGADTPESDGMTCGVFVWRPPAPLVAELSDLLDRPAP